MIYLEETHQRPEFPKNLHSMIDKRPRKYPNIHPDETENKMKQAEDKKAYRTGTKESKAATERVEAAREGEEAKPEGAQRKDTAARATLAAANDYWTTGYGGFHMSGNTGRAVYRYPAEATGSGYDTTWAYVDDLPVGGRQG